MSQGCVKTLTKGNISNVKVTMHTCATTLCALSLFTECMDLDIISHDCCLWPKGSFHNLNSMTYLQDQGHSTLAFKNPVWAITSFAHMDLDIITQDPRVCYYLDPKVISPRPRLPCIREVTGHSPLELALISIHQLLLWRHHSDKNLTGLSCNVGIALVSLDFYFTSKCPKLTMVPYDL